MHQYLNKYGAFWIGNSNNIDLLPFLAITLISEFTLAKTVCGTVSQYSPPRDITTFSKSATWIGVLNRALGKATLRHGSRVLFSKNEINVHSHSPKVPSGVSLGARERFIPTIEISADVSNASSVPWMWISLLPARLP